MFFQTGFKCDLSLCLFIICGHDVSTEKHISDFFEDWLQNTDSKNLLSPLGKDFDLVKIGCNVEICLCFFWL